MKTTTSFLCRFFFIGAFFLLACAISEKFLSYLGESFFRYSPSRLIGFSVVSLLFVIALVLRDIKIALEIKNDEQEASGSKVLMSILSGCAVILSIAYLIR